MAKQSKLYSVLLLLFLLLSCKIEKKNKLGEKKIVIDTLSSKKAKVNGKLLFFKYSEINNEKDSIQKKDGIVAIHLIGKEKNLGTYTTKG